MADALTAEQVAQVVSYIAPGFVALSAYGARVPHPAPGDFGQLVASVVLSLPIVAIANAIARGLGINAHQVTGLPYVALLFGVAIVLGSVAGTLRVWSPTRNFLGWIGLRYQPENSVYSNLLRLPAGAAITVELQDGGKVSGTPTAGPDVTGTDGELMLTHPAWWDPDTKAWLAPDATGAVIVPLGQVRTVTLDRPPQ